MNLIQEQKVLTPTFEYQPFPLQYQRPTGKPLILSTSISVCHHYCNLNINFMISIINNININLYRHLHLHRQHQYHFTFISVSHNINFTSIGIVTSNGIDNITITLPSYLRHIISTSPPLVSSPPSAS